LTAGKALSLTLRFLLLQISQATATPTRWRLGNAADESVGWVSWQVEAAAANSLNRRFILSSDDICSPLLGDLSLETTGFEFSCDVGRAPLERMMRTVPGYVVV